MVVSLGAPQSFGSPGVVTCQATGEQSPCTAMQATAIAAAHRERFIGGIVCFSRLKVLTRNDRKVNTRNAA